MKAAVDQILHMVGGVGENSYAANSRIQEKAILKVKPILEKSISEICCGFQLEGFVAADLGCSSGPNTLMILSEIKDKIHDICSKLGKQQPELSFFINDLPGNDFNNIFRSLTMYVKKVTEKNENEHAPFYVAGAPGSFYGRLFPRESIHLVHSSHSLHWLSQVPSGLEDDLGAPINRGNIYVSKTSPPHVFEAYLAQFQRDFSTFLRVRSKEIVSGGHMVLTICGRSNLDPMQSEGNYFWGLLADALNSLVPEGKVDQENVDSFNMPWFGPAMEEMKAVVINEGSFEIYHSEVIYLSWDHFNDNAVNVEDVYVIGENLSNLVRAIAEPIIVSCFGKEIVDDLFSRYALNVAEHFKKQEFKFVNLVLSLRKIVKT